jgi:WD40 repeat protein
MIVDLVRGGIARTLELPFHSAGRPQFDPARKRLALMVPHTVRGRGLLSLWNYETGREIWTVPFPAPFRNIAFSPDGRRIATTSMENRAVVWDASTGHVEAILDSDAQVRDVHFFSDSVRLLTMSQDGSPRIWNLEAGGQANKLEGLDAIFAQAYPLPDGASVVAIRTSGAAQVLRWRLDGPNVPRTLKAHKLPGAAAALAASDTRFVTQDEANEAAIWNVDGWRLVARVPETERWALSRDGRWFAAVSRTGALRLHDIASGSVRSELPRSPPLKSIAGFSTRDTLAALDEEGHATLFQGETLESRALGTFVKPAVIEMSRDGSRVAVVANKSLEVIDATRATRIAAFDVPEGDPWGIEFSDDAERILVNYARVSHLIDINSRRRLNLASAGASATLWAQLICNGDFAAVTLGNHRFQLHDARTGERVRDFEGAAGIVGSYSCDREAGLIMGSDLSGTMTVWRIDSGQPLARFTLASARLWTNAWVAASRTVAIAAEDGNIYLVPIPLEKRPIEALEASLRCRVPYHVSGEELVRHGALQACTQ